MDVSILLLQLVYCDDDDDDDDAGGGGEEEELPISASPTLEESVLGEEEDICEAVVMAAAALERVG